MSYPSTILISSPAEFIFVAGHNCETHPGFYLFPFSQVPLITTQIVQKYGLYDNVQLTQACMLGDCLRTVQESCLHKNNVLSFSNE